MVNTNRITWEKLRTFDVSTASSASTYYALGIPLLFPSYKLKLVNVSNQLLIVSIDGVSDYDVCPANSFWLYDETQAQFATASTPAIPQGTQIYVKSPGGAATGTITSVYLVSQYLIQA